MRFAAIPGCCGENCAEFEDDFDRADSSSVGNWTEVAGDWSIDTNRLKIASASAILTATELFTDENVLVAVTITITDDSDTARIIADYVDANNFAFLEVVCGVSGTVRLYQRVAGVNTQLATMTTNTTASHEYSLCIHDDRITGSIDAFKIGAPITNVNESGVYGLGTGATVADNIFFDDFTATEVRDNCGECPVTCAGCENGVAPEQLKVVIPAGSWELLQVIPNVPGNCEAADCSAIGGTYFLDPKDCIVWTTPAVNAGSAGLGRYSAGPGCGLVAGGPIADTTGCGYAVCASDEPCTGGGYAYTTLIARIQSTGSNTNLRVVIQNFYHEINGAVQPCDQSPNNYASQTTYLKNFSGTPDCTAWVDEQVDFNSRVDGPTYSCAGKTTSFVQVTAL